MTRAAAALRAMQIAAGAAVVAALAALTLAGAACGGRPAPGGGSGGGSGGAQAALIPRAVLFGNPERTDVLISPDGRHLSWLAPRDGVMNIWVAPVGRLDEARAVTSAADPIELYQWAYTSEHLLYRQDQGGDENFHVFRVDLAGGVPSDLTPYTGARAHIAATSARQPTTLIVMMNDRRPDAMDAYRVDLLTGWRELIAQNDHGALFYQFDHELRPRLATRLTPSGGKELLALEHGAWRVFDTIPLEDAEGTRVLGFAPGGDAIYLADTRGRDTGAVLRVHLMTRQRTVLAEDARAEPGDAALWHPTEHQLQAVLFERERERWHAIDPSIAPDLAALARIDPGADANVVSRTLDDRTWVVATSSPQRPDRYYLWDRGARQARPLFSAQPALDAQPLVPMWPVEITSRDGLPLVSYLTLPRRADPDGDGRPDAPAPLVLWVHGGPWLRDSWGFDPMHQLLANRGYAVLAVNFRGSSGFGKRFLNAGNLEWSKRMHDDLLDAVDWAVRTGVAPRDRICIGGGSYGGYAALVGLAMTPDVFRCGIDWVGMSNLLTFLASMPAHWGPARATMYARIGDPGTPAGHAHLTAASPLTHAHRIARPLLIAQGENDPRVPQAEAEQIVAALTRHGRPVTYALFTGEGHGFVRPENDIAFYGLVEAFLAAHLGGAYEPLTPTELAASSMQLREGRRGVPGLPE